MNEQVSVLCEIHEQVALVTLNKPQRRNALDVGMLARLKGIFDELADNSEVRVVVLTGAGKGFCAGADLSAPDGFNSSVEAIGDHYKPAFMAVAEIAKPVIACINGGAAGGGAALAMLCDLMVVGQSAYLKLAFSDIGLIPDCGANWLLPQAVGYRRAYQMAIEAQSISAASCLELGLANRVEADDVLLGSTLEWATALAKRSPISMALTKQAMRNACSQSFSDTFSAEAPLQDDCMASKDFMEGLNAFYEKREPRFCGQ